MLTYDRGLAEHIAYHYSNKIVDYNKLHSPLGYPKWGRVEVALHKKAWEGVRMGSTTLKVRVLDTVVEVGAPFYSGSRPLRWFEGFYSGYVSLTPRSRGFAHSDSYFVYPRGRVPLMPQVGIS